MSSRKGPGDMTSAELKAIRLTLRLSVRGLCVLLKMPENGDRTIRRWESGEQPDIPGPVQALLELLDHSAAARRDAGIEKLRYLYPPGITGPREELQREPA